MSKVICNRDDLVAIADAVCDKVSSTDEMTLNEIADNINAIGGADTSDATATAGDILSGKTAYVDGEKITGVIEAKTATIYTPTTDNQVIPSGVYLAGAQTIEGDANLKPENIAEGITIFGVAGIYSGGSSGTLSYDTCTVQVIKSDSNSVNLFYTTVENQQIVNKSLTNSSSFSIVCLCNSLLTLIRNIRQQEPVVTVGLTSLIKKNTTVEEEITCFSVDTDANTTATIVIGGGVGN